MTRLHDREQPYRNGDWGPKYFFRGPHSEWGIILLRPGQRFDAHYHETVTEDFFVLEGNGVMTVGTERFPIGPGDAVRAEPREAHSVVNDSTENLRYLFMKSPFLPDDKKSC